MPWVPTSRTVTYWGRPQVVAGGSDVTFYRDVVCLVRGWSSSDPGSDSTATIFFPQITGFDLPGTSVPWLQKWASLDINKINPDGTFGKQLFEGMIISWNFQHGESGGGTLVTVMGALHQLDLYVRAPAPTKTAVDISYAVTKQFLFQSRPHLRVKEAISHGNTGIITYKSGAWQTATEYINEELSKAVVGTTSWTLLMDRPRQPVFKIRDITTVNWTISYGQDGFTCDIGQEWKGAANVIYGEASETPDSTTRNLYFTQNDYTVGPTGTVTVSGVGGSPFYNPWAGGGGLLVGFDETTASFTAGSVDLTEVRVERFVNFGDGTDKATARTYAADIITRDADIGHFGTITLMTDPAEGSRYEIQAGDNILVKQYYGSGDTGILFHIAGVDVNLLDLTTTLTVDTKGRSLPYLYQLIAAQTDGNDPDLQTTANRDSTNVSDDKVPWDTDGGSGIIPYQRHLDGASTVAVPQNTWTITKILAAEGPMQVMKTVIYADLPLPYHVSVWDWDPTVFLTAMVDPFTPAVWQRTPNGFQIGWGRDGQRAGYWPGFESDGDALTGALKDEADWIFDHGRGTPSGAGTITNSGDVSFLWVAFFHANASTTLNFYGHFIHGRKAASDSTE